MNHSSLENKKIAVIGASGFIGGRLVEKLILEEGAKVKTIVKDCPSAARLARFNLTIRKAELLDKNSLISALDDVDIIFHTAVGDRKVVISGLDNTLEAAKQRGVKKIIYVSTGMVYGFNPPQNLNEDSAFDEASNYDYGRSKIQAEKIINHFRKNNLIPAITIFRPFLVYGPRSRPYTKRIIQELLENQGYLVNQGKGAFNGVYIDNLIDAMILAAKNPKADNEDYIITDNHPTTWLDLMGLYCELVKKPIEDIPNYEIGDGESYLKTLNGKGNKNYFRDYVLPILLDPKMKQLALNTPLMNKFIGPSKKIIQNYMRKKCNFTFGGAVNLNPEYVLLMLASHYFFANKLKTELGYEPAYNITNISDQLKKWLIFSGTIKD